MFQEWNDKLSELKGKQRHRDNWLKRREELKVELKRREKERERWAERLQAEQKDVDRLNGISLGALFYTLIGKKEEKLSQEEEELMYAKLQYEEAADHVADIDFELAELQRGLADTRYIDSDIDAVMKEKVRLITEFHPTLAEELYELTDSESEVGANIKELQEAVTAGRSVLSALERAGERLDSARNWGAYDMMGGGLIATAVKHSRIDEARSAIHDAQNRLRRFQSELSDVQRDVNIRIEIQGFLTFADYFFDGFITDWIVQGRIKDSQAQVSEKRSRIRRIVSELETELRKAEAKRTELIRRQTALVENA